MVDPNLSSFIWSVADLLRGDYKQSEYGKVILPFTVLRRLDCVLEETKPSGVEWLGDVPEHWEVQRLKRACCVFPSNIDKKSYDGETPIVLCNYTDVYYNERITRAIEFMPATATTDQIAKFTLRAGDMIITKDSETADDIAVAAFVPQDLPGVVCSYHLSMVRPLPTICGAFVKRLFDSAYAKACFATLANGLTRVGLGQYELDNVELPFPRIAEQTAIAAFLDRETGKIDELVSEQRRLIELLKEKRQAVISHAVTKGLNLNAPMKPSGIQWLGDVPEHWDVKRIKHLVRSIEQGWSPQCEGFPVESKDEWGVLKVGCVNTGTFNPSENKLLPANLEPLPALAISTGDLLISRANTRELVGRAAVAEADYSNLILCDKLYRLRLERDRCLPRFLSHYLSSNAARSQIELGATGASASMVNIGQSIILELSIAVPTVMEQAAIVVVIRTETARLDTLTAEAQRGIELLQERRTALISAAVTGKIDVRNTATPLCD
ncbi:MAG: type I restriction-modification system subunit M N-terminal domain-containing protein [Pirellulaceae bacterium]|nr:type I restriction-modification system subunit M N-terminal domain-containing protein [Pirellulaceae bacterium]